MSKKTVCLNVEKGYNFQQLELFDNLIPEVKGRLLTVDEVAKMLAVKPRTVRAWVYIRKIPFIKVSGAIRFDLHVLKRWVGETQNGNN